MDAHLISTDTVPMQKRLSFWRDVICETFVELTCEHPEREDFFGSVENIVVEDTQFSTVTSAPQIVVRDSRIISKSHQDFFLISLQLQGKCHLSQTGREATLFPGDFCLYDSTSPYILQFDEAFSQLCLRIPRSLLRDRLIDAERLTAITVSGAAGTGRMASQFVQQLAFEAASVNASSIARLHTSALDLLTSALAEQTETWARKGSEGRTLLMNRIMRYIDDSLGDSELNCEIIAVREGISERYLRKLFEAQDRSISEWIWHRRLESARRDLMDAKLSHKSVTTIAFNWGFKDSAHFSRAFRTKYGTTPRDMRRSASVN